ncbi:MAG: glucan biosynthesis protein [Verrucomicrobia bacterium]|nr:glucan biosynthesis protein [Verrucomicrobiota bacterium]
MKKLSALLAIFYVSCAAAQDKPVFGYQEVVQKAESLSHEAYSAQVQDLSQDLQRLNYDLYRRIMFLTNRSVWPSLPYRLGFFHPGYHYKQRVRLHAIESDRIRDIPFSPDYFHYDQPIRFTGHEGFVGFKAFVPSAETELQDEFLTFLGASYFRAVARGLHWGLSARGLAVNTGVDGPEEFPDFREFWIQRPKPEDKKLWFYALLDSPSLTGGYEFVVQYGDITSMDIKATIFIRKKPNVLILAPLTSMFYFGRNTVNKPTLKPVYQSAAKNQFSMERMDFFRREFRPQVHDSDGLLLDTPSGEKVWAPLKNPRQVTVRRFLDTVSYSLLQRDRDFNGYLDGEAQYDKRPSATVIPGTNFGPGSVRLLEIPSTDEYSDNIVAGWEVQNPPDPGGKLEFSYQLLWRGDEPNATQFRVISTTVRPGPGPNETRLTVEYAKPNQDETIPVAELRPFVLAGPGGQIRDVQFTPTDRGWLVSFSAFSDKPALDLSCVILRRDTFCSEKWVYLLNM